MARPGRQDFFNSGPHAVQSVDTVMCSSDVELCPNEQYSFK